MSSRNTYLNEEERKAALVLSQAVRLGEELVEAGEKNAAVIKEKMIAHIEAGAACKNRLCGDRGCTEFRTGVRDSGRDLSCNGSLYR